VGLAEEKTAQMVVRSTFLPEWIVLPTHITLNKPSGSSLFISLKMIVMSSCDEIEEK
jgi:hypothetical protein